MRQLVVLGVAIAAFVLVLPFPHNFSTVASAQASGPRRWRLINPARNRHYIEFEVWGRNGNSTSDDWNNEAPLTTGSLAPGRDQTLNCDTGYSLDIKWHLIAPDYDPKTDIFYVSLVCHGENYVWNRTNDNVREYTFPRW